MATAIPNQTHGRRSRWIKIRVGSKFLRKADAPARRSIVGDVPSAVESLAAMVQVLPCCVSVAAGRGRGSGRGVAGSLNRFLHCSISWRATRSPVISPPVCWRGRHSGAPYPARTKPPALVMPELVEAAASAPAVAAAAAAVIAGRPVANDTPAAPADVVAV